MYLDAGQIYNHHLLPSSEALRHSQLRWIWLSVLKFHQKNPSANNGWGTRWPFLPHSNQTLEQLGQPSSSSQRDLRAAGTPSDEIRRMMQASLTAEERQLCQQVGYWGTSWHPTLLRLHSQESKSKWARTLTGQHPYTKWHFLIAGPGILAHWPEDEGWAIAPAVWQPASQLPLPVWVCVSFSVTEQSSQAVISF